MAQAVSLLTLLSRLTFFGVPVTMKNRVGK
jgi:hypothetical protein